MGYIGQKLWDIFSKSHKKYLAKAMGYIRQNYGIYNATTMGYFGQKLYNILWDILVKTIGYIAQKQGDILGKNYRINYDIYWTKPMGYIGQKRWDILDKTYWIY